MEECCVVCAEPLEWVAIGPCGHREVCALCVVRLRFVLKDTRCCFCKQARTRRSSNATRPVPLHAASWPARDAPRRPLARAA